MRDVSEQAALEADRAALEERYQRILEQLPDAVFIHTGGTIRYANTAANRMFGTPVPDGLVGRKADDFVHPDDLELVARRRKELSEVDTAPPVNIRRLRSDGTSFLSRGAGCAITWDEEDGYLAVVRDITDE